MAGQPVGVGAGAYPLMTPLNGISSARQWSMSFRNDEQIEVFDRILRESLSHDQPDFFRTVVFECPVEVSLSWKLDEREKRMIHSGLGNSSTKIDDYQNEKSHVLELLLQARDLELEADSKEGYRRREKRLYYDALIKSGYAAEDINALSFQDIQNLYYSVLNNTLRLEAVKAWWKPRGPGPTKTPVDPKSAGLNDSTSRRALASE